MYLHLQEEDPLDAFMKSNAQKAVKEKEKADAHQRAWDAQYADKDVEICEKIEEEKNMNLHCYVCKMWGHTKARRPRPISPVSRPAARLGPPLGGTGALCPLTTR